MLVSADFELKSQTEMEKYAAEADREGLLTACTGSAVSPSSTFPTNPGHSDISHVHPQDTGDYLEDHKREGKHWDVDYKGQGKRCIE